MTGNGEALRRPAGLHVRGRGYWDAVTAEFELTRTELELLAEVCRVLDEIEALRKAVQADGVTVPGSRGQLRPHPALRELRDSRSALHRLTAALALPDPDGRAVRSPTSLRAVGAANTRWDGWRDKWGDRGPA